MSGITSSLSAFYKNTKSCICNIFLSMTFSSFKGIYKVKQYFHKTLKDNVSLNNITNYGSFSIYSYTITQHDKVYVFNYIIPNNLNEKEIEILKNNLLKDTLENIQTKEDYKKNILHASFVNQNEDVLCDITEELHYLKYYFNSTATKNDMLFWNDILQIIQQKYNRTIDKCNTYVYIILNDEELTEKTLLLSGILNEHVRFSKEFSAGN